MGKKISIFLLLIAAIFGVAGFLRWKSNLYSKEVLKLEILGPEEITSYQEVDYTVKYKNNGNIRLEEPKLVFEYPRHSTVKKEREEIGSQKLGDIYPGQEKVFHFKTRLFGKAGDTLMAKATLSYRPKNLKARYESSTTFTTSIKSVPFSFDFDIPSKIESGKELKLALNYFSNIDYPLLNLRVEVEYPPDFEFIQSTPQSLEKVNWEIPVLNKAEGGRIEIKGKLRGKVGEQKIFQAKIGIQQEGEFVLLKGAIKGVEIVKPTLYITQQINSNPEYIASPGDMLHYEIFFKNIGEKPLRDLSLITTLTGSGFDFETLKSLNGEYEKGDNSIFWDWRRESSLQFLDVNQEGKVEFWVKLKKEWEIPSSQGEEVIKNKVYLSQAREEFVNKVNSKLEISQKAFFSDEVFGNSGPIPPKIGKTTTYTVMWQVKNHYNNVKDTKIKATLPRNVKLTGKIFPAEETEEFAFDSKSREIIWNLKELKVGQGILNPAPNISFQVAFTPNSSQKGETPEIIGEAKIEGLDEWTKQTLQAVAPHINTTLPDDKTVTEKMGIVQ